MSASHIVVDELDLSAEFDSLKRMSSTQESDETSLDDPHDCWPSLSVSSSAVSPLLLAFAIPNSVALFVEVYVIHLIFALASDIDDSTNLDEMISASRNIFVNALWLSYTLSLGTSTAATCLVANHLS